MPIVPNTITQQTNPLFKGFTPYALPSSTVVCDFVSDMVSVDLVPSTPPTKLTYDIGAESTYTNTVSVKNLTNNSSLEVVVVYDKQIFSMSKEKFTLAPREETTVNISLNRDGINALPGLNGETKSFTLRVTNLNNGELINKNSNVSPYTPRSLPETIVVK